MSHVVKFTLPDDVDRFLSDLAIERGIDANELTVALFSKFWRRFEFDPALNIRAAKLGWDLGRVIADMFPTFVRDMTSEIAADVRAAHPTSDELAARSENLKRGVGMFAHLPVTSAGLRQERSTDEARREAVLEGAT